MKETRSVINSLLACGIAFAMVSTLAAQTSQGTAKVVRLKGDARYKIGSNEWQPLKVGDVLRPGTIIQTAARTHVDFALGAGSGSAPVAMPVSKGPDYQRPTLGASYQPSGEQNVVRMWENTLLSIDKLTITQTGADEVTETALDLKAGHIFGMVKKMSAASKYEIKIPTGVAGIRGSAYDILAEGVIKMQSGSAVLAYSGPNGTVLTQVVMAGQMFDARTGTLTQLSDTDRTEFDNLVGVLPIGFTTGPTWIAPDQAFVILVSPH